MRAEPCPGGPAPVRPAALAAVPTVQTGPDQTQMGGLTTCPVQAHAGPSDPLRQHSPRAFELQPGPILTFTSFCLITGSSCDKVFLEADMGMSEGPSPARALKTAPLQITHLCHRGIKTRITFSKFCCHRTLQMAFHKTVLQ